MRTHSHKPVGTTYVSLMPILVALMFSVMPAAMAQVDDDTKFSLSVGVFQIDWNGTVFPVDTVVDSDFDLEIYKLAYFVTQISMTTASLSADGFG